MPEITTVTVFVDWNSQLYLLKLHELQTESWFLSRVFERLFNRIHKALIAGFGVGRFKIDIRLYYGWFKGFEEQAARKEIRAFIQGSDFASITQSANAFVNSVAFGDVLLSALESRRHGRLRIHLPNTLRNGIGANKPPYEKMVDTALASDFIVWASRIEIDGLLLCDSVAALVLAEDDDCWPPVLTAEPLWVRWGGRAYVVQDDPPSANMPNVTGLLIRI